MCLIKLIFLPFIIIGKIAALGFKVLGWLLAFILGLVFIFGGIALIGSLAGAIVGIPLVIIGLSMIFNGAF